MPINDDIIRGIVGDFLKDENVPLLCDILNGLVKQFPSTASQFAKFLYSKFTFKSPNDKGKTFQFANFLYSNFTIKPFNNEGEMKDFLYRQILFNFLEDLHIFKLVPRTVKVCKKKFIDFFTLIGFLTEENFFQKSRKDQDEIYDRVNRFSTVIKLGLKRFGFVIKKAVPGSGYPLLLYMIWRLKSPQHVVPANLNDSSAEKNLASSDSSASPMEINSGTPYDFWSFVSNQNQNASTVVAQSGELGKEYTVLNFDVIENSVPNVIENSGPNFNVLENSGSIFDFIENSGSIFIVKESVPSFDLPIFDVIENSEPIFDVIENSVPIFNVIREF